MDMNNVKLTSIKVHEMKSSFVYKKNTFVFDSEEERTRFLESSTEDDLDWIIEQKPE